LLLPSAPHCCHRDGKLYLRLDWTPERLAAYDTHAWLHPTVHESASPAALESTLAIIKVRGGEGQDGAGQGGMWEAAGSSRGVGGLATTLQALLCPALEDQGGV